MKEWLYEKGHEITKPLSIKTESLDIDGNTTSMSTGEDSVEFVHCLPSPSTNALSHLRRSSMSNCSNTRDAASNAVTSMGSSSLGSAKKVSFNIQFKFIGLFLHCTLLSSGGIENNDGTL